jgi:hypothetical protein
MKNILKTFCVLSLLVFVFAVCSSEKTMTLTAKSDTHMVTTTDENQNVFWVGTFQMLWNDLTDKIVHGPVNFVGGNPKLADILNKKGFSVDMLSSSSYYKVMGHPDKKLKAKIEKDIYKKFGEKSDILDLFQWSDKPDKNTYFLYTMLIKKFDFVPEFSELAPSSFNNSKEKYKFFGINSRSKNEKLRQNVKVLFYNSDKEYAVMLKNNQKEDVILYRTDSNKNFDELYKDIESKSKNIVFGKNDNLKVPFISVDEKVDYNTLCGKQIKGTSFFISKALQTVKFNMDNTGGKLNSEAGIMMKSMVSLNPPVVKNYFFDKKFVLFMKESDKPKPYFALKVKDARFLVPAK